MKTIGTSIEEIRAAEIYICYCTQIHGEFIIHGDQLTMDRVISAVKLQKPCVTAYGSLKCSIHTFAEMIPAEASLGILEV